MRFKDGLRINPKVFISPNLTYTNNMLKSHIVLVFWLCFLKSLSLSDVDKNIWIKWYIWNFLQNNPGSRWNKSGSKLIIIDNDYVGISYPFFLLLYVFEIFYNKVFKDWIDRKFSFGIFKNIVFNVNYRHVKFLSRELPPKSILWDQRSTSLSLWKSDALI